MDRGDRPRETRGQVKTTSKVKLGGHMAYGTRIEPVYAPRWQPRYRWSSPKGKLGISPRMFTKEPGGLTRLVKCHHPAPSWEKTRYLLPRHPNYGSTPPRQAYARHADLQSLVTVGGDHSVWSRTPRPQAKNRMMSSPSMPIFRS
jgi:hypothetical protein